MIRRNNVVKVTDFGIAKSSEGSDITRVRFTPGTQNYMSPEQARGIREIDARSDIYSLGVVFYQMVTGKIPPYPVPDRLTFVPPRYEKIILKCLAEDPAARYQSAKDLVDALDEAKEGTAQRKNGKTTGKLPKKRIPLLIGASVVAVLIALSIWQYDTISRYLFAEPEATPLQENQGDSSAWRDRPEEPVDHEIAPLPHNETSQIDTNNSLEAQSADYSATPDPYEDDFVQTEPVLRPAANRVSEILAELDNQKKLGLQGTPRSIFALKTGFLEAAGDYSDLAYTVQALLDQMDVVRRIDQGECDLLIVLDSMSQNVLMSSNLYGDDQVATYQERIDFQDEQQLFATLETVIQRYYCFNLLRSLSLLKPTDDGFAAEVRLNGGSSGMLKVGDAIDICLTSNREAYALLLSVNADGMFLLHPQMREEHVPLSFNKPLCTGPMEVSPPAGSEMVAAILCRDRALVPVDGYLASEDQLIIEPASWAYSNSTNNAVEFCEILFDRIFNASPDQFSVDSVFLKTYD